MKRTISLTKILFPVACFLLIVIQLSCEKKPLASSEEMNAAFYELSIEELNTTIREIEASKEKDSIIKIKKLWMNPAKALETARKIKSAQHLKLLTIPDHEDATAFKRVLELTLIDRLDSSVIYPQPLPEPPEAGACSYATADELVASCPGEEEIQKIRSDFNIYFESDLIDNGILVPWECTQGGSESSIMLSMYNTFRLLMCIPFDTTFPWAPEHNNLYEWLKSLDLTAIGYFWAEEGEYNHGWNKRVYLAGNNLNDPMYRDVINTSTGVGIVHAVVLMAHESRHAGTNISHNCGYKDTNLDYMGAWAVQYHLLRMLAENTGDFFSEYQKNSFSSSAQYILETRFCDSE